VPQSPITKQSVNNNNKQQTTNNEQTNNERTLNFLYRAMRSGCVMAEWMEMEGKLHSTNNLSNSLALQTTMGEQQTTTTTQ
jgi:hypothetical protein